MTNLVPVTLGKIIMRASNDLAPIAYMYMFEKLIHRETVTVSSKAVLKLNAKIAQNLYTVKDEETYCTFHGTFHVHYTVQGCFLTVHSLLLYQAIRNKKIKYSM